MNYNSRQLIQITQDNSRQIIFFFILFSSKLDRLLLESVRELHDEETHEEGVGYLSCVHTIFK